MFFDAYIWKIGLPNQDGNLLPQQKEEDGVFVENGCISNVTPPKTNMEPENGPLEKEIPIGNHHFQVPC